MSEVVERKSAGESRSWRVRGMDCPSCVGKVEKAASRVPGVQGVSVNLMAETLTARLGANADPAAVVRAVEALGYQASPQTPPASTAQTPGHRLAHSEEDEEPGPPGGAPARRSSSGCWAVSSL